MYTYIHKNIYIHYAYIHAYIHTYVHTYIYTYIHIYGTLDFRYFDIRKYMYSIF